MLIGHASTKEDPGTADGPKRTFLIAHGPAWDNTMYLMKATYS